VSTKKDLALTKSLMCMWTWPDSNRWPLPCHGSVLAPSRGWSAFGRNWTMGPY